MIREKHGAGVLFVNAAGSHVLLQRKDGQFFRFPNRLCIIGGQVEEGETPVAAALREIREEFGQNIAMDLRFFRLFEENRQSVKMLHFHHIFWSVGHDDMHLLPIREGARVEWVAFDRILNGQEKFIWSHGEAVAAFYHAMAALTP
jgi:8-oxo-dGTP pyrophosphatase MutT (NUDIX family)